MNTNRVSDWFQIVASLGVLIGLLLVAYELARNEAISIGTLANQGVETLQTANLTYAGENPAPTIAKACLRPEDLSEEDYFILDAIYTFRVTDLAKMQTIQVTGEFNVEQFIDLMARIHAIEIGSTLPGRAWMAEGMADLPAAMREYAKSEIVDPTKNCSKEMNGFMARTKQMTEQLGNGT